MSVAASHAVWEHSLARQGSLLVMLAVADHAGPDGACWPGTQALAVKARIKVRRTQDALTELDETGELDRWHFRDGSRWRQVFQITVGEFAGRAGQRPAGFDSIELHPGPPPTGRKCLSPVLPDRQEVPADSNQENEVSTGTFQQSRPALSDDLDRHFPSRVNEPSIEPSEEPKKKSSSTRDQESASEQLAAVVNAGAAAADLNERLHQIKAGIRLFELAWAEPDRAMAWLLLADDEATSNPAGFVMAGMVSGESPSPRSAGSGPVSLQAWVDDVSWRLDVEHARLIVDERCEDLDPGERAMWHQAVDEARQAHAADRQECAA